MLKRIIPIALACALAVPATLPAQESAGQEPGQLYAVSTWNIDPSDASAWEAGVKQLVDAAGKVNLQYHWAFWQAGSEYILVFPVDNFAYFDDPMQFMRAFSGTPVEAQVQQAMAGFSEINAQVIAEEMAERKPEWSYEVEGMDFAEIRYGIMEEMWLKPGSDEAFEKLNEEWRAFVEELDYPYPYSGHTVHFGDAGRVVYVTLVDDLSEYYGEKGFMKMVEAHDMGERFQQLIELFSDVARRWKVSTIMLRHDLSYWPETEAATR